MTPWWCHALEMFVYNKILLKSSLDYSQNDLGSNDILMKKINVLVWTNGVNWTILDDWQYIVYEGWASFEKSSHFLGSNGNLMKKLRMNIQQGGRHHADLPLPGVQNSHPILSKMLQPRQGSWRVDTCRKKSQQCLHTKNNFPVRFRTLFLVWLVINWLVSEKREGTKKNENEHPTGVAPPCRPPPAGCSEFPSHAF